RKSIKNKNKSGLKKSTCKRRLHNVTACQRNLQNITIKINIKMIGCSTRYAIRTCRFSKCLITTLRINCKSLPP
ncbi:hypothetical protein L9F63_022229, partial [Diploptera punctata]